MRRLTSKSLCSGAAVIALMFATMAGAGQITSGAPILPEAAGTTPTAPTPAVTPKKKQVVRVHPADPFEPVTIDLPPGDDVYPDKPGALAVDRNCLSCHSPELVANQPQLTRAQWAGEVKKMRDAYKAVIADDDEQTILDYLVSLRGEARQKWR